MSGRITLSNSDSEWESFNKQLSSATHSEVQPVLNTPLNPNQKLPDKPLEMMIRNRKLVSSFYGQ
jgi:hypothetical protein